MKTRSADGSACAPALSELHGSLSQSRERARSRSVMAGPEGSRHAVSTPAASKMASSEWRPTLSGAAAREHGLHSVNFPHSRRRRSFARAAVVPQVQHSPPACDPPDLRAIAASPFGPLGLSAPPRARHHR